MGLKLFSMKTNKIQSKIYKNLFWILSILGIFILYLSSIDIFTNYFQDLLEKIGLAVLSSGVFASVLKSIQFSGIFRNEIEKVVMGTKFLEKRNDLPILWKKISRIVYNKKFPAISNELENIVLNTYFPTNHKFYYENFIYTLNIEELSDDNVIKFTQVVKYTVVLAKDEISAELKGHFNKEKKHVTNDRVNEREYFKINGVDRTSDLEEETIEDDFDIKTKYRILIENEKSFDVETKERREYSINDDYFKLLRVNAITREMDVSIKHPSNMTMSFFNIGLVNEFERKHTEHELTISRVLKKGLILPHQGFGITFGPKYNN